MELLSSLLFIIAPFAVLLALGLPVAFTFLFIMMVASISLMGSPVGPYMTVLSLFDSIATFSLAPVPLFVLMGEMLLHSGLAVRSLNAISKLVGKVPARLSILANIGGSFFGMVSGSTMASTAVLGSTLVPEMRRQGYSKALSFGPVLAAGGLAMIIPPSSLAIIYGTIAQISIGKLLIAGAIPGFIMAFNYIMMILLRVKLNPNHAPICDVTRIPLQEKMRLIFVDLVPMGGIVFLVTGIFILGVATPTESAALGAMGTVIIALIYRCCPWKVFSKALTGTATITTMTLLIIGGSIIFSQLLSYSGITRMIVEYALGMSVPPIGMLLIMLFIILVLGCFMESVPIMMVTIPIFVPVANAQGFDPIWFGIVMLIGLQIGLTTPPFGLLLFVMKGVAPEGTTMRDMYMSAAPFLLCDCCSITLVILFPSIALWLPNLFMR